MAAAAAAPIPSQPRDLAHEALILRTRDLTRRIAQAAPTSSLGRFKKRLRQSLLDTQIPESIAGHDPSHKADDQD